MQTLAQPTSTVCDGPFQQIPEQKEFMLCISCGQTVSVKRHLHVRSVKNQQFSMALEPPQYQHAFPLLV